MHDLQQITVKLNWFGVFTLSLPHTHTQRGATIIHPYQNPSLREAIVCQWLTSVSTRRRDTQPLAACCFHYEAITPYTQTHIPLTVSWLSCSSLLKSFSHSVSASHSAPALGRLSHFLSFNSVGFFVFFIPSSSSQLLPFKAPIPQGWNPLSPSRAVALFEGCCDDRPRLCRRHTASSQRLYSGPAQHSTVGAFHNPTNTLTLSLTVNSTSASCQRGREQGHAVSQRDTHRWTQKIQAHTHTSGSSILHPRW